MTLMIWLAGWIACAVGAAGFWCGYFNSVFPGEPRETLGMGLLLGVAFGPISLVVMFCLSGFGRCGWRLWPRPGGPR